MFLVESKGGVEWYSDVAAPCLLSGGGGLVVFLLVVVSILAYSFLNFI